MSSSASLRSSHLRSDRKRKTSAVSTQSRISRKHLNQVREQVAAVCYRIQDSRLEFLLVRTRHGGRWIFPKGGVEPGLTRSQSAALEALEEAGVHGSIEEAPFAEYAIGESAERQRLSGSRLTIATYLCAVQWLTSGHEENRNPTWFSPEKAKKRLSQHCERRFAKELCRVVDRAVMRIDRLQSRDLAVHDPLRLAYFDAPELRIDRNAFAFPAKRRRTEDIPLAEQSIIVPAMRPDRRILQLNPAPSSRHGAMFSIWDRPTRESLQRRSKETRTTRH